MIARRPFAHRNDLSDSKRDVTDAVNDIWRAIKEQHGMIYRTEKSIVPHGRHGTRIKMPMTIVSASVSSVLSLKMPTART